MLDEPDMEFKVGAPACNGYHKLLNGNEKNPVADFEFEETTLTLIESQEDPL